MAYDATDFTPTGPAPVVDPLTITDPKERLAYLRDFLRALPEERFDMQHPGEFEDAEAGDCGSAACIGGWARALFRTSGPINIVGVTKLGLSADGVDRLFFPHADMADGTWAMCATTADAADVLDHLIRTGEVDWSVARAG